MSNQPNDGRRPTKAERKEQARLEREAIQRQMASRKRTRTIGLSLVALAAVAVIVAIVVLQPGSDDAALATPAELLARAPEAAQAAACTDVETTPEYPGADAGGVAHDMYRQLPPPLDTYPTTPPASGPHADTTLPAAVYDSSPDMGSVIHSLEHGGSVVWYSPDAPQEQIDAIRAFYGQSDPVGQDRAIVAPYDYEGVGGQLPDGVQLALVAWHRLQTCVTPSLEVAFDFTSQYSAPPSQGREYAGEAPEAGGVM